MLASIPINAFDDTAVVTFDYDDAFGRACTGIVVRHNGQFHAFRNRCPHWSTPLDDDGPTPFDPATGEWVCQTHGARFESSTGRCVSGPCRGESLTKFAVEIEDDRVVVRRQGLDIL